MVDLDTITFPILLYRLHIPPETTVASLQSIASGVTYPSCKLAQRTSLQPNSTSSAPQNDAGGTPISFAPSFRSSMITTSLAPLKTYTQNGLLSSKTNSALLKDHVPDKIFDQLSSFFDNLSPFDPRLKELDPAALRISFLLGAGASKPSPSNIPTVKELLPQLLERARRLDREDVTQLSDFCEQRKIDNIEDLLTAAQLATFCSRNSNVLRLMNHLLYRGDARALYGGAYEDPESDFRARRLREMRGPAADLSSVAFLQDTLQVLFGLLSSTMLPAKPNLAHQSIADYVKKQEASSIVTTNYDCCIDLALGNVNRDFVYAIDFSNVVDDARSERRTRLIKLHGSLNWYYCETCQEIQLVDIRQTVKYFLEDKSPYPVIGICRDCGGQRRGLLVPPLAMKFDVAPPLTPLLTEAKAAFETADLIVVVGFSFAEADVYISRMLSKSMQMSAEQNLLVVDPDSRIVDRIRRKFKASIPNFDPQRISRMIGDCADLLPRFLGGELKKESQDARLEPAQDARVEPATAVR